MSLIRQTKLTIVDVCMMEIEDFYEYGDVNKTLHGPLIYQDNNAKILGVGHLDYVLKTKPIVQKNIIQCPQLDDRLGVYCLIDALPRYPAMPKFDILLTTGEEHGQSTAEYFDVPREYNWIFELDRRGDDVVTYCYSSDEWNELLEKHGFHVGQGAFSDISSMEHLECKAFNLGIGYYNQHTYKCYADLSVTKKQLKKLAVFAEANKNIRYPHYQKITFDGKWTQNDIYEHIPAYLLQCRICGEELDDDWRYCPYCGMQV